VNASEKFAIGIVTTMTLRSGRVSVRFAENVVFTMVGDASRLSARAVPCTLPLSVNWIDCSVPRAGLNFGIETELFQFVGWSGMLSVKQVVAVVCAKATLPSARAPRVERVLRKVDIVRIRAGRGPASGNAGRRDVGSERIPDPVDCTRVRCGDKPCSAA